MQTSIVELNKTRRTSIKEATAVGAFCPSMTAMMMMMKD